MLVLLTKPFRLFWGRFWQGGWAGSYDMSYAAGVSVWMRWLVAALGVYVMVQRPFDFPASQYAAYGMVIGFLIVLNGFIHYRQWSGGTLTWRWMLALTATDVALVTAGVCISGGLSALFTHLLYYPALAVFAVLFTSLKLNPGVGSRWLP